MTSTSLFQFVSSSKAVNRVRVDQAGLGLVLYTMKKTLELHLEND